MANQTSGKSSIFERLVSGEDVPMDDPDYSNIFEAVKSTKKLTVELNRLTDADDIRAKLGEIVGYKIDESTTVFTPFHTNVGRSIKIGKNVFINHLCSFLDLGGITIEDNVMIGPRVNITSENHPVDPLNRNTMIPKGVTIKKNAWVGAAATILPGVTIGENSVVAAGALVNQDVPPNTVVGGVPAKIIKRLA